MKPMQSALAGLGLRLDSLHTDVVPDVAALSTMLMEGEAPAVLFLDTETWQTVKLDALSVGPGVPGTPIILDEETPLTARARLS